MRTYTIRCLMIFEVWLGDKILYGHKFWGILRGGHKDLFNFIYPDYDRPLTIEQQEELFKAFKPWRDEEASEG